MMFRCSLAVHLVFPSIRLDGTRFGLGSEAAPVGLNASAAKSGTRLRVPKHDVAEPYW
jgi:hypothetical protein